MFFEDADTYLLRRKLQAPEEELDRLVRAFREREDESTPALNDEQVRLVMRTARAVLRRDAVPAPPGRIRFLASGD